MKGIFRYRPRDEQLKREKMFDAEKQKMSKLRFAERLEIEVNDEVSDLFLKFPGNSISVIPKNLLFFCAECH